MQSLYGKFTQGSFLGGNNPFAIMKTNIVIIGFMGAGKSEIGKALAARVGMKYIDTDSIIGSEEGRSISDVFEKDGETYFRNLETKLLDKLSGTTNHVISTGGGMVLREENVKKLKSFGPLVLLTSKPEIIEKRLSAVSDRPLLNVPDPGAKIREMLKARNPVYNHVADFTVDTSEISIDEAVDRIAKFYKGETK